MSENYMEGIESKYDGATLACFYSSMGLNRELFQVKNFLKIKNFNKKKYYFKKYLGL